MGHLKSYRFDRILLSSLLIGVLSVAVLSGCATGRSGENGWDAPRSASEADRLEALDGYGEWVVVNTYGRVWRPLGLGVAWRPYSQGYWSYRRAGWTWISAYSWGWVPFHYGRWVLDPVFGWVWVPGNIWGPAWVSWRYANTYIGWAPLPPIGYGFGPTPNAWWCYTNRGAFRRWWFRPRLYPVGRNERLGNKASPPRRRAPGPVKNRFPSPYNFPSRAGVAGRVDQTTLRPNQPSRGSQRRSVSPNPRPSVSGKKKAPSRVKPSVRRSRPTIRVKPGTSKPRTIRVK